MKLYQNMIQFSLSYAKHSLQSEFRKMCIDANKWCGRNFGIKNFSYGHPDFFLNAIFTFRHERDMGMFILAWNEKLRAFSE